MSRIEPINIAAATGPVRKRLDAVQKKLGMVPNLISTLANSPVALGAYSDLSNTVSRGRLSPQLREQIALTVSQANQCAYCLAAHSAVADMLGLTRDDIKDARLARSTDRRVEVALQLAKSLVENRGPVSDRNFSKAREAGFSDEAILEIVANVALTTLTNYANHVAQTEVDFPPAQPLGELEAAV